jgi:hypothetical protein
MTQQCHHQNSPTHSFTLHTICDIWKDGEMRVCNHTGLAVGPVISLHSWPGDRMLAAVSTCGFLLWCRAESSPTWVWLRSRTGSTRVLEMISDWKKLAEEQEIQSLPLTSVPWSEAQTNVWFWSRLLTTMYKMRRLGPMGKTHTHTGEVKKPYSKVPILKECSSDHEVNYHIWKF